MPYKHWSIDPFTVATNTTSLNADITLDGATPTNIFVCQGALNAQTLITVDTQTFTGYFDSKSLTEMNLKVNGQRLMRRDYTLSFTPTAKTGVRAFIDYMKYRKKEDTGDALVSYSNWLNEPIFHFSLTEYGQERFDKTSNRVTVEARYSAATTAESQWYLVTVTDHIMDVTFRKDQMFYQKSVIKP
jgi:hypothetical protein